MKATKVPAEFEALLDFLKHSRGFDFTGYKRSSLLRRVRKRLQALGLGSFVDYLDYLELHQEEFTELFNTILINVTAFFRDPPCWQFLAETILPRLLELKRPDEPIRVWCAGCSTGQEAYSAAMLLCEALGEPAFLKRVKVYATDVDEQALAKARQGVYTAREVEGVPAELLARYFECSGNHFIFHKNLRRAIIFGRHDLVQDAPISRIDLLICRNTLMYFNAETQSRILAHLHFALSETGFLFLGKAEMLLTHANLFTPVNLHQRVFSKVSRSNLRERLLTLARMNTESASELANHVRLRDTAFDSSPLPQVVVNSAGTLALANEAARALFGLTARDLGRPLQDLELSYRPAELRSLLQAAYAERRQTGLQGVEWRTPAGVRYLDVQVVPLQNPSGRLLGACVAFTDVTRVRELQADLARVRQELETTNEELQATNEELETINDELRQRTDELNEVNAFLESILSSLQVGVAVVDRELRVLVWNRASEDLWGLRAEEVDGRHLLSLDIGLPVARLAQPLRACLAGEQDYQELALAAVNRRGRAIQCKVTCSPLIGANREIRGVILLMKEQIEGSPGEGVAAPSPPLGGRPR